MELIQKVEQYERSLLVVAEESIYGNAKAIEEQSILRQLRPTVVHCSAGVGRTGVYCAVALCIKRLQEDQKMDLITVVKHLRTQRPAMIQTADQYEFVYRCMVDYMDITIGIYSFALTCSHSTAAAAPVAQQESIYQNLAPARPKRMPPKPPTRSTPAQPVVTFDATGASQTEQDPRRPETAWDLPSAMYAL